MAILSPQTEASVYELFNSTVWINENGSSQLFSNGDSFFLGGPTDLTFWFNFSPVVFLPQVDSFIFGAGVSTVDIRGTLFQMDGAFTTFSSTGTRIGVEQDISFGTSGSFTISSLVTVDVDGDFTNSGQVDIFGALVLEGTASIDVDLKGDRAALRIGGDMTGLVTTDAGAGRTVIAVDSGGTLSADPTDNINLFVVQANSQSGDAVIVNNSGTINGTLSLAQGDDAVTNSSGAVIDGTVNLGIGANTVSNAGQITGDIVGGMDVDTLTLFHDSRVEGGISLGNGNDQVTTSGSGAGSITVAGAIFMGFGNDTFTGSFSSTAFQVDGNEGDDSLNGSTAADTISGGTGTNTITGNAGVDTFVFNVESGSTTITDFAATESPANPRPRDRGFHRTLHHRRRKTRNCCLWL